MKLGAASNSFPNAVFNIVHFNFKTQHSQCAWSEGECALVKK